MNLSASSLATAAANLLLPDAPATTRGGARAPISAAALDRTVDAAAPAALATAVAGAAAAKVSASRARRTSTGYATTKLSAASLKKASTAKTTTKKTSTTKASGDLAFLSDPKLSIEEKLFRFMKYFATKYEQQLEAKLKEVAGKAPSSKAGGTTTKKATTKAPAKKKSGIAKLLTSASVQRLAKQLSGPVLSAAATAVGLPALAPILMKAGPDVVTVLGDLVKVASGGGGSGSSGSNATTTAAASSGSATTSAGTEELSKADALEIERLQEKQKEMFSLVSNVLRGMHDTKMAVINNVRS